MKYKIAISGSAVNAIDKKVVRAAVELGRQIARHNAVLLNGATTGVPAFAARGAKKAGGMCIGFSPAMSVIEHTRKYRLPTEHLDLVVYTGFGYSGRNLFLIRSADAVIFIAGRIGTLNEFTNAFEDRKPMGVLTGTGGTSVLMDDIVQIAERGSGKIAYDDEPRALVRKVLRLIDADRKANNHK